MNRRDLLARLLLSSSLCIVAGTLACSKPETAPAQPASSAAAPATSKDRFRSGSRQRSPAPSLPHTKQLFSKSETRSRSLTSLVLRVSQLRESVDDDTEDDVQRDDVDEHEESYVKYCSTRELLGGVQIVE